MYVDKSRTYIGIVEDNVDPKRIGRCKVRVIDIFDNIPVNDIPWASPWKDLNGNEFIPPEKGKILTVVFDSGNIYKPEYICSEHYNVNLENKLKKISESDYTSMRSLMFDHKTQIYSNDSEGLMVDYKFNNLNLKEKSINFNLKDNHSTLNIGDETAGQQAILGNHWMDWFDEFVENLLGERGGPYLGNLSAPVVATPQLIECLQKYREMRDPVFLSHHVNIVDNNQVKTVKMKDRENSQQLGDKWKSTVHSNNGSSENGSYTPREGIVDLNKPDDPSYLPPNSDGNGDESSPSTINRSNVPLSDPKSNPKIDKLIRYMKSKGYVVYDGVFQLNIVGMRNQSKDTGKVSNKFDDKIIIFYKNNSNNWTLVEYDFTVVPGYSPGTQNLKKNVSILQIGQYVDQYKIGYHQGNPDHRCLKYANTSIHRNVKTDIYDFSSPHSTGNFGINIHRSGNPQGNSVFNWSEGCQVFKHYSSWEQFMNLCDNQVSISGKNTFTYTLCRMSDFNSFS